MTTISTSMGGAQPQPGPRSEQLRHSAVERTPIDWTQPQFATPQLAPDRKYGCYVEPKVLDVPQLPERNIRVKSKPPASMHRSA